eukprot:1095347-Prorocentrum_minimum.AAC.3
MAELVSCVFVSSGSGTLVLGRSCLRRDLVTCFIEILNVVDAVSNARWPQLHGSTGVNTIQACRNDKIPGQKERHLEGYYIWPRMLQEKTDSIKPRN